MRDVIATFVFFAAVATMAAAVTLQPREADACARAPGGMEHLFFAGEEATAAIDGGFVIPVFSHGVDADDMRETVGVEVLGPSDSPEAGQLRVEKVWEEYKNAYENHGGNVDTYSLLVWTADKELKSSDEYNVRVTVHPDEAEGARFRVDAAEETGETDEGGEVVPYELSAQDGGAASMPDLEGIEFEVREGELAAKAPSITRSGSTRCEDSEESMCQECRFTDGFVADEVSATLPEELRGGGFVYELELVNEQEPYVSRLSTRWGATLGVAPLGSNVFTEGSHSAFVADGPKLYFNFTYMATGDDFRVCPRLVARRLSDGATRLSDKECLTIETPREDSMADVGRPSSDADSGSSKAEVGPDAGSADGGTTEDAPWADNHESSGCGCRSAGRHLPGRGISIWFALVGFWWQRRRM